jgi:hypothetical protein
MDRGIQRICLCVLSIIIVGAVFIFFSVAKAVTNTIIITELGAHEANGHEWVEIYNNGIEDIDLAGWKFWEAETNHGLSLRQGENMVLVPGDYAVITQNDVNFTTDYPNVAVTIIDSSWGGLNEGGEEIGLKDANGNFVEKFTYVPARDFSLERKDYDSNNYSEVNWEEHVDSNSVGTPNSKLLTQKSIGDQSEILNLKSKIYVNEFVSNPNFGENEWIEIYNSGTETNLTGWTVEDGIGTIYTFSETIPAKGFFVIELFSSKLNNTGDVIAVKDLGGVEIDKVVFGNWDHGGISDNFLAPGKGNSLAKSGTSFFEDEQPTKGTVNNTQTTNNNNQRSTISDQRSVNIEQDSQSQSNALTYVSGDIVINELVSDPTDGAVEFVELYNRSGQTVNLIGWWMEEGSESRSSLEGTIAPGTFYVLEKPKGNLNNSGDTVILFDSIGAVIDKVTYGKWDDGNLADNAEKAVDPYSLARKVDGQDADNDFFDFIKTKSITKGSPNIILDEEKEKEGQKLLTPNSKLLMVRINELYPNPPGSDREKEFIELKNIGTTSVDLTDWLIGDNSRKRYKLKEGIVGPGQLYTIRRSLSGIALNNSGGEMVSLFAPDGSLVSTVEYIGSAVEDFSYSFDGSNWVWSSVVTANNTNVVEIENESPIPVIDVETEVGVGELVVFDASDTTDAEDDKLSFHWDYDDEENGSTELSKHRFAVPGVYTVTLTVTDSSSNEAQTSVIVTVKDPTSFVGGAVLDDAAGQIRISEFLPNPIGSDNTEFIELFNPTGQYADLSELKLDDEEGGSRGYTFPFGTAIGPGEYLVFGKQVTGIALNNTSDSVRLLFPDRSVIQEVAYKDVPEGASYAIDQEDVWQWTEKSTPGKKNVFLSIKQESNKVRKQTSPSRRVKQVVETTLENIRRFDVGDLVRVTGVVAVKPGVLGGQFFYIVGSPGIQVYQHKKDFPDLAVGDLVEVNGELSEAYGELRLKVKGKESITKIEKSSVPDAIEIEVASVGEEFEGSLIKVVGEVTETKSSYLYIDDGTEEIQVYFKKETGIERKNFAIGDLLEVVGIVSERRSGYQLLPRSSADINKVGKVEDLGEKNQTNVEDKNKNSVLQKYLTATAVGLFVVLLGLFAKKYGSTLVSKSKSK